MILYALGTLHEDLVSLRQAVLWVSLLKIVLNCLASTNIVELLRGVRDVQKVGG